VYPSAYANAYASKICAGKIKDPSGVKRKDFKGPKRALGGLLLAKQARKKGLMPMAGLSLAAKKKILGMKVGKAVSAGSQSGMGRLQKSGLKMNTGGMKIKKVAKALHKASAAHKGQAKTLDSIKVRGGGMAIRGLNFQGVR
jgi:hypothetical protein